MTETTKEINLFIAHPVISYSLMPLLRHHQMVILEWFILILYLMKAKAKL